MSISCAGIIAASAVAFIPGICFRSLRIESPSAVYADVAVIFMLLICSFICDNIPLTIF